MSNRQEKLLQLEKLTGVSIMGMLEEATEEGVAKAICINPACNNVMEEVEPDVSNGECRECGTKTIQSCLVLAGLI